MFYKTGDIQKFEIVEINPNILKDKRCKKCNSELKNSTKRLNIKGKLVCVCNQCQEEQEI